MSRHLIQPQDELLSKKKKKSKKWQNELLEAYDGPFWQKDSEFRKRKRPSRYRDGYAFDQDLVEPAVEGGGPSSSSSPRVSGEIASSTYSHPHTTSASRNLSHGIDDHALSTASSPQRVWEDDDDDILGHIVLADHSSRSYNRLIRPASSQVMNSSAPASAFSASDDANSNEGVELVPRQVLDLTEPDHKRRNLGRAPEPSKRYLTRSHGPASVVQPRQAILPAEMGDAAFLAPEDEEDSDTPMEAEEFILADRTAPEAPKSDNFHLPSDVKKSAGISVALQKLQQQRQRKPITQIDLAPGPTGETAMPIFPGIPETSTQRSRKETAKSSSSTRAHDSIVSSSRYRPLDRNYKRDKKRMFEEVSSEGDSSDLLEGDLDAPDDESYNLPAFGLDFVIDDSKTPRRPSARRKESHPQKRRRTNSSITPYDDSDKFDASDLQDDDLDAPDEPQYNIPAYGHDFIVDDLKKPRLGSSPRGNDSRLKHKPNGSIRRHVPNQDRTVQTFSESDSSGEHCILLDDVSAPSALPTLHLDLPPPQDGIVRIHATYDDFQPSIVVPCPASMTIKDLIPDMETRFEKELKIKCPIAYLEYAGSKLMEIDMVGSLLGDCCFVKAVSVSAYKPLDIRFQELAPGADRRLLRELANTEAAEKLLLPSTPVSSTMLGYLGKILRSARIRELSLAGCLLGSSKSLLFTHTILAPHWSNLQVLNLSRNRLCAVDVKSIVDSLLLASSGVQELDLSHNLFGDDCAHSLTYLLQNQRTLRRLILRRCALTAQTPHVWNTRAAFSSREIENRHNLELLDISYNSIRQEGFQDLFMSLCSQFGPDLELKHLDVSYNHIVDVDNRIQFLFGTKIFLRTLNLSGNPLSPCFITHLCNGLSLPGNHVFLTSLTMNSCLISDTSLEHLSTVLKHRNMTTLKSFGLKDNSFKNHRVLVPIFEAQLDHVDLSGCGLHIEILLMLSRSQSLRRIAFTHNTLFTSHEHIQRISSALADPASKFEEIDLTACAMQPFILDLKRLIRMRWDIDESARRVLLRKRIGGV